jgi:regulator of protease activity HflC (stomatin/prohibitin superfamily)
MQTGGAGGIVEEKAAAKTSGMGVMALICLLAAASVVSFATAAAFGLRTGLQGAGLALSIVYIVLIMPLLIAGLKVLKPNEAYVLTLFGKYYGTPKGPGFYFVNPFAAAARPSGAIAAARSNRKAAIAAASGAGNAEGANAHPYYVSKKISLKAMTLSNERQKINDIMGNPIEIGIVVIWRVVNTAKAIFSVDDYKEFLSIQCDSALRNIVRLYPYDVPGDDEEASLRGSSQEVAGRLKAAIQENVEAAGLEVEEARITHLAYAPEIAAAMLQRQQAAAIIDARTAIVKGAVDMVQMALDQLSQNGIVDLDEERKASMVSNLLVVLCGNKDVHPVVNSGSIY